MSEKCSVPTCNLVSNTLCYSCQLKFCRDHMFEHGLSTHLELNPLLAEMNQINNYIQGLNGANLFGLSYQKLDDWRQRCHHMVDIYFNEKTKELKIFLNKKVEKYEEELDRMQTGVILSLQQQEITREQINLLTFEIENLQKNFKKILQNDFQIHMNPLIIDENLVNFEQVFDISTLPPVYRVIDRNEESFTSLAGNNQFLLLHHEGTLLLVDEQLSIYKQIPWTFGPIYDMCYSTKLKRFIIITENEVFLLYDVNMSINKVRSIPWQQWFSCTCSDISLYLSTKVYNSALIQFNLSPSIAFFKRWESPDICAADEGIDGIIYHDNKLALMISNDTKKIIRMELRSATTLGRLWSLSLNIIYNPNQAYRFCSFNRDEWLVADHSQSRLLHVTKDGIMKSLCSYQPPPCCVTEFGNNILAISTKTTVHFHKI